MFLCGSATIINLFHHRTETVVACMNNMTGDPNQENRPSVFGFEPYPSLNVQPIDWSRIPYESAPVPLIPSGQFNPSLSYQQTQVGLGNFSFCAAQAPHPVQFPFPTSPSVENAFTATPSAAMRCKRKTDSPT